MESRRDHTHPEKDPSKPPAADTPTGMTRRNFLRGIMAYGAAAATGLTTGGILGAGKESMGEEGETMSISDSFTSTTSNTSDEAKTKREKAKQKEAATIDRIAEICLFIKEQLGPTDDRTVRERREAQKIFWEQFGEQNDLKLFLEQAAEKNWRTVYNLLCEVGLQGLSLARPPNPEYELFFRSELLHHQDDLMPNYFLIRAKDYWPKNIFDAEIDPRATRVDEGDPDREVVQETIDTSPAWLDPQRLALFRDVAESPEVRQLFITSDCTLAEAYSLIKAAIKRQENVTDDSTHYPDIIKQLLADREIWKTREIIGSKTDTLITFHYYDPKNDLFNPDSEKYSGNFFRDLSHTLGIKHTHIFQYTPDLPTKKNIAKREYAMAKKLFSTILRSRGNTTIFFDTHGSPEGTLEMHEDSIYKMDYHYLASALLQRLVRADHREKQTDNLQDELAEVTIVLASCFSYDFTKKLIETMKHLYETASPYQEDQHHTFQDVLGIPFTDISLPNVIAGAQEGSVSYDDVLLNSLRTHRGALEKTGGLQGDFLSQVIQPEQYMNADITFFKGERGKLAEIGIRPESSTGLPV